MYSLGVFFQQRKFSRMLCTHTHYLNTFRCVSTGESTHQFDGGGGGHEGLVRVDDGHVSVDGDADQG